LDALGYDAMGRLTSVARNGALVEAYRYDAPPYGTRTYQANALRGIAGRALTYSAEDHLLSTGTAAYAYDPDGFLELKTEGGAQTTYAYSRLGELQGVDLPDGRSLTYVYDPLGRRIAKKVNGTTT
jgi:YD repeat-containing protein